jgi:RHS repeat-associated protein
MGNITRLWDHSLKTIFYNNAQVQPLSDYTYDPIYRLITAIGREQIAQAAFAPTLPAADLRDYPFMGLSVNPNDLQALETYTETYVYDPVGNFQTLNHNATNVNWQRSYQYNAATPTNNRLLSSTANAITEKYTYDLDGNISAMAQLSAMGWDFKDELIMTRQQVVNNGSAPGTYYVYDSGGQRVRKVNQNAAGTIVNERIYLGTYEIYREYANGPAAPSLERQTLHVMDDKDRVALVETAAGNAAAEAAGADIQNAPPFYRYQLTNHLSSALLELDATATILTFEEYYPYGCSSFQAVQNQNQTPKRYRYTGKERDEENGLYYHGARYYAPWLGRWVSCDPAGFVDGPNLYFYVGNNPTHFIDQDGMQEKPPEPDKEDNGSVFSGWAKQNRNTALAQVNEQSADAALLLRALSKIPGLGSLEKAAERIESANAEAQKQAEPISGPKETAGALLSIGLQTIVETKTHLDAMNQTGGTNEEGGEIPPVTPPAGKEVTPPPANGNSIPAANRIAQNAQKGAANDTMAQFSLEHADPIFQGSTNQKFSLKDASGKTLTTGPGRTGSRFPDIQVPAGDNAKSGIELKALSDPTIDPAKVAATSNQLAKEQKFMSNGPVFSGPKDKMWDYVSDEGGTGLTTGMWYWFPPKGQQ